MSEKRLGLLFPGQGSQHVGMGRDLAEGFPEAARVWEEADDALGFGLSDLCWNGPEAELIHTRNAQPAIFVHSAAAWAVVARRVEDRIVAAAGHSLGEFSALHAADVLTFTDALRLVRQRGELMFAAGVRRQGTMAAILGLADEVAEQVCRAASAGGERVVPANFNAPGQLVISGDPPAVARAISAAKEAGARRALPLNVSGAFHSPLMSEAEPELRRALDDVEFSTPSFPVISNVTAAPVDDPDEARDLLVRQLTSPVRWTESIVTLRSLGATRCLEIGPGSVLTGLVKRIEPEMPSESLGTAQALDSFLAAQDNEWN